MAFQTRLPAFESHAAPEHLDDFRPFAHAHVHQPHRAHPPGIPPGNETPGPDHDVHRRIRPVHVGEQPLRESCFPLKRHVGVGLLHQQLMEGRGVADIDHAEHRVIRAAQVQLTLSRGQIDDVEISLSVEQDLAQIGVHVVRRVSCEVVEPAGEVVVARLVRQAGLPGEQTVDHGPHRAAVCQHPGQKVQNAYDVGLRFHVCLAGAGDGLAQEHPERFGHVEGRPLRALVPPDSALLVEGQQATKQVHVAVCVFHPARQVRDRVILAVAVIVKLAIGVVEQQAFAVGVQEFRVFPGYLIERSRILERKAAAGQFLPPLTPHPAGRTQVPFINQHQVVVAEVLHGHALDALLLGQLVQVDDLNV